MNSIAAASLPSLPRHRALAPLVFCGCFLAAALIHSVSDWLIVSRHWSIARALDVAAGGVFVLLLADAVARSPSRQSLLATSSPMAWFIGVYAACCGFVLALSASQVGHEYATSVLWDDAQMGIVLAVATALYVRAFRARTTPPTPELAQTAETAPAVTGGS